MRRINFLDNLASPNVVLAPSKRFDPLQNILLDPPLRAVDRYLAASSLQAPPLAFRVRFAMVGSFPSTFLFYFFHFCKLNNGFLKQQKA